jgi:hypothetical protein
LQAARVAVNIRMVQTRDLFVKYRDLNVDVNSWGYLSNFDREPGGAFCKSLLASRTEQPAGEAAGRRSAGDGVQPGRQASHENLLPAAALFRGTPLLGVLPGHGAPERH